MHGVRTKHLLMLGLTPLAKVLIPPACPARPYGELHANSAQALLLLRKPADPDGSCFSGRRLPPQHQPPGRSSSGGLRPALRGYGCSLSLWCGIKDRLVPHTPLVSLQPPASLQVFALAEASSQTRIMLDYVQEFLEIRISIPQHNKSLCELARKGGRLLPHLQAGGAAVVAVALGYRLRPPHPPPTRPMARPSRKLAGRAPAPAQDFWFHRNGRPAATLRGKWNELRFSSAT